MTDNIAGLVAHIHNAAEWMDIAGIGAIAGEELATDADDLRQAATALTTLSRQVADLEAELTRLTPSRFASQAEGDDDALRCFAADWEPLRSVAARWGKGSASQLASRARRLVQRGLVEKRWIAASICEWRLSQEEGVGNALASQEQDHG